MNIIDNRNLKGVDFSELEIGEVFKAIPETSDVYIKCQSIAWMDTYMHTYIVTAINLVNGTHCYFKNHDEVIRVNANLILEEK